MRKKIVLLLAGIVALFILYQLAFFCFAVYQTVQGDSLSMF